MKADFFGHFWYMWHCSSAWCTAPILFLFITRATWLIPCRYINYRLLILSSSGLRCTWNLMSTILSLDFISQVSFSCLALFWCPVWCLFDNGEFCHCFCKNGTVKWSNVVVVAVMVIVNLMSTFLCIKLSAFGSRNGSSHHGTFSLACPVEWHLPVFLS